ncbi:MAG: MltA domain-containing protein [Bacteroidota bacterium]
MHRLCPLISFFLFSLFACQDNSTTIQESDFVPLANDITSAVSASNNISKKGKIRSASRLSSIYTSTPLDSFAFPVIDELTLSGLHRQRRLLRKTKRPYNQKVGNLTINHSQLMQTVDALERWQHLIPIGIEEELEAHQIWGKDRKGNVKFTAYFSPVVQVSKRKTTLYKYPIRSKPKGFSGRLPSRSAIEVGALDTVTQHLAYAASKTDIYYMQLQGSAYVQYRNGKRELFSYAGDNNHPYRSVELYLAANSKRFKIGDVSMEGVKSYLMRNPLLVDSVLNQNPSYTFFRKSKSAVMGAGLVPLEDNISVAVDPRYIPLGSCLLASVPVLDEKDNVIRHEYRILFAQDTGGAIKGAGRVDIYFGVGGEAQKRANNFNAYGRLWLLLPKQAARPLLYSSADIF